VVVGVDSRAADDLVGLNRGEEGGTRGRGRGRENASPAHAHTHTHTQSVSVVDSLAVHCTRCDVSVVGLSLVSGVRREPTIWRT
jgi:hypothetical protein